MDASNKNILTTYAKDIKSQHGEDGIIAEMFHRMGAQNKWCVEFGALNGTHHSNTWNLIIKEGWSGVLIEADPTYAEKLQEVYKHTPRAHCFNEFVEFEGEHSLDSILARTPIPQDFDLLSIDIDGNDYHIWDSLTRYHPRAVIIEFNPTIPNDVSFIQPRERAVQQGSSLYALAELGRKKGYRLVAVAGVNAFFILEELFPKLGIPDQSIDEIYIDTSFYTRLFQLYDGTLIVEGNKQLLWHKLPIRQEDIQILPARRRTYPAGVSSYGAMRSLKYYVRKLPVYATVQKIRKRFFNRPV